MMNTRQAYVAGPYSAASADQIRDNIADALRAGLQLSRLGWTPIVPHAMGNHRISWNEAMRACRLIIAAMDPERDALLLLPNWKNSRGAVEEERLARAVGLPVLTLADVTR